MEYIYVYIILKEATVSKTTGFQAILLSFESQNNNVPFVLIFIKLCYLSVSVS